MIQGGELTLRSAPEIHRIRLAARLVSDILAEAKKLIVPGMKTSDLDRWCRHRIEKAGAESAPALLGFPASVCTSVGHVAVHGVPGERALKPGDLITMDVSLRLGGWYADAAVSFGLPPLSPVSQQLLHCARAACLAGIAAIRPGLQCSQVGKAISQCVEERGMAVIPSCLGHGVGRSLHELPVIPSSRETRSETLLQEGMIVTVEPVITPVPTAICDTDDGWSKITESGLPTASWEEMVYLGPNGIEVLTSRERR